MFKHILVAFDGTPGSQQALRRAIALARVAGSSLTALSVEEKLPAYAASVGEVEEAKREMDAYFARIQAAAVEQALAAGVTMATVVRAGHAAQVIVRLADEGGFDLIVVGADGRRGLGGTADRVTESAPCSVLVARAGPFSLHVRDIMSREVLAVSPTTPLDQVVRMLIQRGVKATPVVQEGRLVGIITGVDLLQRAGMRLRLSLQRALPAEMLAEEVRQLATEGKTAADVMTSPVVSIREDSRISEAVRLMTRQQYKRLPVVDAQGALVGIVGRLDVLRLVASIAPEEEIVLLQRTENALTASDLMIRDVPTTGPDASLDETLYKLVTTPLRRVVVVDESRRVLGIVLDSDLLAHVQPEAPGRVQALIAWLSHRVSEPLQMGGRAADVMTRPVFTVQPDTPLAQVAQEMLERRVKRLVVTDAEGRLVGMVDRQTLLHALSSEM